MTFPRNLPNLNLLELGKPPPCRPSSKARNNPNYNSWVKSGLRVSHTYQFARFLLNFIPKARLEVLDVENIIPSGMKHGRQTMN